MPQPLQVHGIPHWSWCAVVQETHVRTISRPLFRHSRPEIYSSFYSDFTLEKIYFGGGTMSSYSSTHLIGQARASLSERFEDGTIPFLDILAADVRLLVWWLQFNLGFLAMTLSPIRSDSNTSRRGLEQCKPFNNTRMQLSVTPILNCSSSDTTMARLFAKSTLLTQSIMFVGDREARLLSYYSQSHGHTCVGSNSCAEPHEQRWYLHRLRRGGEIGHRQFHSTTNR